MENPTEQPGYTLVFTKHIRLRNGRILHAYECGRKVFVLRVKDKDDKSE